MEESLKFCGGRKYKGLAGKIACNIFFEPSTRTQYSFLVAQQKVGMGAIDFDVDSSSLQKNESFYDTIKTFDSLGTDVLIIRHSKNEYYKNLIGKISTPIINAGDGTGNHPTQSLLDILTIEQEFGSLKGLEISIIGDISHSRVAHTNFEIMSRFGAKVFTSGPKEYSERNMNFVNFKEAISRSDVVIMLRVQRERHSSRLGVTDEEYNEKYGLNSRNLKFMKKDSIIMHPGPVNRNVEISGDLMEIDKSRISKQVRNGVFVRMAVLKYILEE